ncbi:hypothetical protein CLOM_g270 [Closterium sp. NIES-68]|nr:hypothetical protein CLOM_g270 [Closterium sp. NIES-68]GJP77741.1 hypothetical protein CLOP_g8096 [Closterium sp. NIES-67]
MPSFQLPSDNSPSHHVSSSKGHSQHLGLSENPLKDPVTPGTVTAASRVSDNPWNSLPLSQSQHLPRLSPRDPWNVLGKDWEGREEGEGEVEEGNPTAGCHYLGPEEVECEWDGAWDGRGQGAAR